MKLSILILSMICAACAAPVAQGWEPSTTSAAASSSVPGKKYTVTIDPALTVDDRASLISGDVSQYIVRAVDEWVAAAPGLELDVQIGTCQGVDGEICIFKAMLTPDAGGPCGEGLLGCTYGNASEHETIDLYTLDMRSLVYGQTEWKWGDYATMTIAHELGHAMGLVHNSSGNLMCRDASCATVAPSTDDVAQWEAIREVKP